MARLLCWGEYTVVTAVLVVDDDDFIREALRELLSEEGYTVYEAPDGKAALQRLGDHPTGMVVLLGRFQEACPARRWA